MQSNPSASSKACIVTGAARRLGREIALGMAHAGWDVVVHYRHSGKEALQTVRDIESLSRRSVALKADLDRPAELEAFFHEAVLFAPDVSCLVNSASRFEFDRPETVTAEAIALHMQSNLIAPVLLTRLLHAHLKSRHSVGADPAGSVIHLLDQKLANPNPDFYAYTLSKSALQEAVRLSAMAFAPVLRVVGLSPGITLPSANQTEKEFSATHVMTPLGASSRPAEIAQAVVYLAQARAVTGTVLVADGGQHLIARPRDVMMSTR